MKEAWKEINIGDYVYGYQKGVHKVIDITDGCGCGKCFHLQRILNSNYSPGRGKSMCDGAWLTPVSKEELEKKVEDFSKEALENVRKYL